MVAGFFVGDAQQWRTEPKDDDNCQPISHFFTFPCGAVKKAYQKISIVYIQHGALLMLTSLRLNFTPNAEKRQVFCSEKGVSVLYLSVGF